MNLSNGAAAPAFLALACVGFVASAPAHAATDGPDAKTPAAAEDDQDRAGQDHITVNGQIYQPKQESPKNTRPLRDTPQTVTVITAEVMEQQNILSLRDALATVPGITFGAGEGGSGYGDSINLRGFSANNDITVDNVRDSAQYTRSDNFNIEQIEVTNGSNSVYSGGGSVAGNINLVSKRPTGRDHSVVQAGVGTDDYYRATADIERKLSDSVGVRLNAMYHHNDVPGREVENAKRWGVMPSVTFGLGGPTKLTLIYLHQEDNNIPQFGVPYVSSVTNGFTGQVPGTSRSGYYGFRNLDKQDSNLDQATAIIEHELSSTISLRNLTRYQDVEQYSIADGPEGTFCLPSGFTAAGLACTTPGLFTPSGGSRGNTRDTRNQIIYNQTDLKGTFDTFGIEHSFDLGFSMSREFYDLRSGNSQRAANGATVTIPPYAWNDPNLNDRNVYSGPVNFIVGSRSHAEIANKAVYLFDTMKLSNHFELNGGVRWERNIGENTAYTIATSGAALGQITAVTRTGNRDSLFSYRIGAVYKPVEAVSLYVAYGNSKTPSQSTVNGSCSATGASQTCNVKPEGAKNYEIGGKAELFHGGLLLTAALFRTDRDSYKVASNDPTVPDQQLDGHSRVDGIALGATGHITSAWQITANYTYLKSKLIQSLSNECIARPGPVSTTVGGVTTITNPCGNSTAVLDPAKGAALNQTPKHSGSIYTAYSFPFGLTVGYGATYQGRFAINLPALTTPLVAGSSTLTPVLYSKSYLVHNLTLAYDITHALQAQLNVKNIGDKLYYTRIRANNGWATPGDGRSAVLTLSYKF
ncbi:catecholate siderophore receptor [Sphingomonas kyeonggiensis]|uniref:TonB-dependent receptor n=1 Tax=Sphingomonas kyeonggiensis TaxID=1268553 RepID=UPI002785F9D7|nr:TonB-dependent receptor [Sphingomonas kyeonggiensis]MDQ0249463.1 catecholate siderophore receptor [Sphingomonas kyeonggiensis]